jgi:hypothetical protein
MPATASGISRAPRPSSLADVLDLILDKGLVIDAYVRVSALGIEVLTIDARIVVASVDTYLRFAEAVNRLDLNQTQTHGIQGLTQELKESGAKGTVRGAVEGGMEAIRGRHGSDNGEQDKGRRSLAGRRRGDE